MSTEEIDLHTLCDDQLPRLAALLTEDDEWSAFAGKALSPLEWLSERSAAESLGWGATRGAFLQNGLAVGFITADWVDEAWTGEASVLECGTYLFKSFRGSGLGPKVKSATLEFAQNVLHAAWVVYVVPLSNVPAVKSLRKQFPMHEYPFAERSQEPDEVDEVDEASESQQIGQDSQRKHSHRDAMLDGARLARANLGHWSDSGESLHKRFAAWMRYREWKEGTKLTLFAIPVNQE